jgi:hypothetical protein
VTFSERLTLYILTEFFLTGTERVSMQLAKSAAIVVIAAAASGGIALAAASPSGAPAQPGRELPSNAASQAQEHAAVPLSSHPSAKASKAAGQPGNAGSHGRPHPNLNGLCHAWLAGAGSEHGKARSNPAFTALITAAGGQGKVAGYCATVIKAHPSGTESDDAQESDDPQESGEAGPPNHPDKTNHPGNGPKTTPAGSHPTGPPSGVRPTK